MFKETTNHKQKNTPLEKMQFTFLLAVLKAPKGCQLFFSPLIMDTSSTSQDIGLSLSRKFMGNSKTQQPPLISSK